MLDALHMFNVTFEMFCRLQSLNNTPLGPLYHIRGAVFVSLIKAILLDLFQHSHTLALLPLPPQSHRLSRLCLRLLTFHH